VSLGFYDEGDDMSTASQGRAREHRVRDHLTSHGWELIARSAGSKGPADLVMASPVSGGALIQVGTQNKTLGPADRERLLHAAWLCSALPLLAVVTPRQPIRYFLVTSDTASKWTEWSP
jgi:hypothetical protein